MIEAHHGRLKSEELACADMVLTLLVVSDLIRKTVYDKYLWDYDLSEGNISLLMALNVKTPLGIIELSESIGIKPPTASIMIKRMLDRNCNFIKVCKDPKDFRNKKVFLTEEGKDFIERKLLPKLYSDIRDFLKPLNISEQEEVIRLLKKLL